MEVDRGEVDATADAFFLESGDELVAGNFDFFRLKN